MPVVYGSFYCGPTRAALHTAKLIGLELEFRTIDLKKMEHKTEEYTKINPVQTVPTFVDDDGFRLFDSHAIVTYLVSKYAKEDTLYPKDLKQRAIVDSMLHFNNASLLPALIGHLVRSRVRGLPVDAEREELVWARLSALEGLLEGRKFAAGPHVTLADVCLAHVLTMVWAVDWDFRPYPRLTRWRSEVERCLPFYEEVVVKGEEALRGRFAEAERDLRQGEAQRA